jgi:transposase
VLLTFPRVFSASGTHGVHRLRHDRRHAVRAPRPRSDHTRPLGGLFDSSVRAQILEFDRRIMAWHRSNETSKRLDQIPGVGPALATALVASVPDPKAFRSGRHFSAWIGLVPRQHSSGGKDRLGSISKQGDRYLRGLFTAGALAVIRYAKIRGTGHRPWLTGLLARRPTKVAAIALANKLARMAWGDDGQGRALSGTGRAGGLNEIAPVIGVM